LLFLVVLALLCCLPVTTVVPGVLALLYTWSCCCSWLFWHYCIPGTVVVPDVLPLLYSILGAVTVPVCSGIAVLFTCYYLLFLVVLALMWCLPVTSVCWHCYVPGAVAVPDCSGITAYLELLLFLMFCHCCTVYLELLLFLFVLALLCCLPVTTCCSWCSGIAVYLELLLFLVVLALL
jgi:hypothetical protein